MTYRILLSFIAILLLSQTVFSQSTLDVFYKETAELLEQSVSDGKIDYQLVKEQDLTSGILQKIAAISTDGLNDKERLAYLINVYNVIVVDRVAKEYPVSSVQDIAGFFDKEKHLVDGENITLNQLEDSLLEGYKEPALHFVLVCGAVDCPPIINRPYRAESLEAQLEEQTRAAINDPQCIRTTENGQQLSKIFKWYKSDFESKSENVLAYINQYRNEPISDTEAISYYNYNWGLNDKNTSSIATNNAFRYVVSSTIRKGGVELKIFNNLYSQQTGSADNLTDRSSFMTTTFSFLYGLDNYFNIGFNGRYRQVLNSPLPSSAFDVLVPGNEGQFRQGITAFGPQIRWAPVPKWENFSVQSFYTFAIGEELEGNGSQPFIDWNGATWVTQVFNDFSIGDNFSLFTDLSFWLEDIGSGSGGAANRFSTPVTLIGSYFPTPKWTLYVLGGYSPYWNDLDNFDYFRQFGLGTKYQFTRQYEIELLYTDFENKFLADSGGTAATYNFGFRYNY